MFKLFDLALTPRIEGTEKLYFNRHGNEFSFDTFFNSIPLKKLRKYTTITELNFSSEVEIYTENGFVKAGENICLAGLPDDEILYLKTDNIHEKISVYAEGVKRNIHVAVIICTYKRVAQVKENIDHLTKYIDKKSCEIILVDNASEIPIDLWDEVTIVHNINNGGSGGFSCGMKKALSMGKFTHLILMDDDITIDSISIQKTVGFLSFLKEEYSDLCISGSMLYSDRPSIQFESGGNFSVNGEQIGFGYGYDLSDFNCVLENEREKNINYGGWWFMCMPIKYASEGNFPAPFFIKYDDVEYALRCKLSIITLNGVGVWHDSFGSKYNSVQEYFNARNYLFLMKRCTPDFTSGKAYKKARYFLLEKLCRHQYDMAMAVLLAYEDYLKGEEHLSRINYSDKLNELKELNYEMLNDAELNRIYGVSFGASLYDQSKKRFFRRYMQPLLYGHLIPWFLCRKLTVTDVISDRKEHYFGAGMTLHYDRINQCGYVTKKSVLTFFRIFLKFKKRY